MSDEPAKVEKPAKARGGYRFKVKSKGGKVLATSDAFKTKKLAEAYAAETERALGLGAAGGPDIGVEEAEA